jgi:hypothetical protein
MRHTLLLGCLLAAGVCVALAGCHRHHQVAVYDYDVEPAYVVVPEAPPAIIVEYRSAPPSEHHVWIDGYWDWNKDRYVWQRGHWQLPPHEGTTWIPPRYERHEHGNRYLPGHWRGGRAAGGGHAGRRAR